MITAGPLPTSLDRSGQVYDVLPACLQPRSANGKSTAKLEPVHSSLGDDLVSSSKIVLFSDVGGRPGSGDIFLPLNILAIGTVLRKHKIEVIIVDGQIERDWRATLGRHLTGSSMFGVSALTGPSLDAALDAVLYVRSINPTIPIVWGGYHATHSYKAIFAEDLADYIIRGPGERPVIALVDALASPTCDRERLLATVPALVYRKDGSLRLNEQPKIDVKDVVPIDYSLVEVEKYLSRNGRVLHSITSYGCPHACTFCVEPTQSLRRWRGMTAAATVTMLADLYIKYKPNLISLHDPNFSSSPYRVASVVRELESRAMSIPILCDMRAKDVVKIADLINPRSLRTVGFESIFLGLESGSNRILRKLQKGSTSRDALSACQILDDVGIETLTSFLHDIPDETEQDRDETFHLLWDLARLSTNRQRHHFFTPYPATSLFAELALRRPEMSSWTQRDWAKTGTYWGSSIWPGHSDVRTSVLSRLRALQTQFPKALDDSGLPQLEAPRAVQCHTDGTSQL